MKRWIQQLLSSFSARLSLWVTGIVTAVYVVSLYLLFRFSLSVRDESLDTIMQSLLKADNERLLWEAVLIALVGLFLILLACRLLINGTLKPLDTLADNVKRLSNNNFGESIPYDGRQDEIGSLQESFSTMQQTLANYIHEIHQKTETLKQRQQELEAAHERAQEDQRVKTAFLQTITQQIAQPVGAVHALSIKVGNDYQTLTKEEMSQICSEMMAYTNEITRLNDQQLQTLKQQ